MNLEKYKLIETFKFKVHKVFRENYAEFVRQYIRMKPNRESILMEVFNKNDRNKRNKLINTINQKAHEHSINKVEEWFKNMNIDMSFKYFIDNYFNFPEKFEFPYFNDPMMAFEL